MLFAYFDESMGSIGVVNHGEVGIQYRLHQYKQRMSSQQYHKVMICFLILVDLIRFSVEYYVVKFSSFG